ncbi:MAG: aspartate--tRNA ligase [Rickettsiales bacterium]
MHKFRTHNCGEITAKEVGKSVKISGWIHRKRDHGNLLFIDLRDFYGVTQIVFDQNSKFLDQATHTPNESVITITGKVVARSDETVNKNLPTGEIEIKVESFEVSSESQPLPLQVNSEQDYGEEIRLKYKFLDLRREKVKNNIVLRSQIIDEIRNQMKSQNFLEMQTPILTSSSPEGARDFLVPSRLHPGKFYALPQAPQIFKQLIMTSGFDRYFQIAPCFRDEDSRADRSPGEFYQLDMEMAFATQEDVFNAIEPVIYNVFKRFSKKEVTSYPFPKIAYKEAMLKYGSDKPDLRNPIEISDVTDIFVNTDFSIFVNNIKKGAIVRAIPSPKTSDKPRSYFDKMIAFAQENGAKGLAYIIIDENGEGKGPIAKFLDKNSLESLKKAAGLENGDAVFLSCDKKYMAEKISGVVRNKLGESLGLIDSNIFKFCWIVDFPFYEQDPDTGKIDFSHNPFSMPQGELDALEQAKTTDELLDIIAYQYDIVCNGVELSSGAIRNHKPELMYKAFEIAGYKKEFVDEKFSALINAFKYGAPPHGGIAPGVDRIVMLLLDEPNIREIILFPMNQKAEDIMMNAPSTVDIKQLRELNIDLSPSVRKKTYN